MASEGLDSKHLIKCGHDGCSCLIGPMDHFCGEHCAKASDAAISGTLPGGSSGKHSGCACGHAECSHGK